MDELWDRVAIESCRSERKVGRGEEGGKEEGTDVEEGQLSANANKGASN